MIEFNKKLIFRKFFFDNTYFFLSAIFTLGIIVWVIQAVNFLDFVTEDGHGLGVYFKYSLRRKSNTEFSKYWCIKFNERLLYNDCISLKCYDQT